METHLLRVVGIRVIALAAITSALVATSAIGLLLTSPATVAAALDEGRVGPIARELAIALFGVLRGLLAYL